MYQAKNAARSEFVPIRQLDYHVWVWGEPAPDKVPLVMVHGWMDVAASWQFMVDAFAGDPHVIAPDWRGYGLTRSAPTDAYWFPDYLADLDLLLDHYAPDRPVNLVGHSMGGNVAMLYAGVRPQRVRRLVNLEGFGMPATTPSQAPRRLAKWIDELKAFHRGELDLKSYDSADGVAQRLMKTNARLGRDKAQWLTQHWARPDAGGRWRILGDPAHKVINPQLSRVDEVLEIYRAITAPVLAVETTEDSLAGWWRGKYSLDEYHQRLTVLSDVRVEVVSDAGHMVHHDQPQLLAGLVEAFLAA
ncbi:alpha/beta hydrolase [Ramlibacter sp.]|uniref:alpha/beta fold hydrolase n=1 Tax=Ramlibacter sp. TaxID=1917967 RepID=UPI002BFA6227|nr:alpha/beta hydrolase [Ramlibacter sp.]HWI82245.1 alpha/beta hydrolase [Ramlibacter sp.]